ncbi:hypothetical protein CQW49_21755 (plasmid) [Methylosinus trichosporium OB3b]|uniref:HPt domain-containing protein n=1 Tax=Methylosinus trichosporium (strain ATCC 35070 / NCIMB 11131 / UNIQEM 75 / OB3b) TaxID=595536 RepID=A0A2D2D6H5_METT3|nr:hypothetical protein CQW49_21755 [Methylosinus trichosporium OB3b]
MDHKLLLLEETPEDDTIIGEIFRLVHTLKGNSGLFDMRADERSACGRDVLDRVRDHTLLIDSELTDALLAALDFVNRVLDDVDTTDAVPARYADDAAKLAGALRDWLPERSASGKRCERGRRARRSIRLRTVLAERHSRPRTSRGFRRLAPDEYAVAVRYRPAPDCFFKGEDPLQLLRTTRGFSCSTSARRAMEPDSLDVYRANSRHRRIDQRKPRGDREPLPLCAGSNGDLRDTAATRWRFPRRHRHRRDRYDRRGVPGRSAQAHRRADWRGLSAAAEPL